jgi:transcription elongation factor Elf1
MPTMRPTIKWHRTIAWINLSVECDHRGGRLYIQEIGWPQNGRREEMDLSFQTALATEYKGATQKIRIMSEHWVSTQVYCPNCGNVSITSYKNNSPVADFFCSNCEEDYELKGHKMALGAKIVDGAYRTMMERLRASNNPNEPLAAWI